MLLLAGAISQPRLVSAQIPGLPVIQNGFASSGMIVAANYGHATGANAFGGAAAWAPGSARFQLSAGLASTRLTGAGSSLGYGVRLAVPMSTLTGNRSLGLAPFVGAGGSSKKGSSSSNIPAGVGIGFRRGMGANGAMSLFAAPFYQWSSTSVGTLKQSAGAFRGSAGIDVSFSPKMGATLGGEFGSSAKGTDPGPKGSSFGVALSFKVR